LTEVYVVYTFKFTSSKRDEYRVAVSVPEMTNSTSPFSSGITPTRSVELRFRRLVCPAHSIQASHSNFHQDNDMYKSTES